MTSTSSLLIAEHKDAIKKRLAAIYETDPVHAFFDVKLTRPVKHSPRKVQVNWVIFPFEDEVKETLGDLFTEDVVLERRQIWSCGIFHADAMDAWKAHEGNHHLVYEDADSCCSYDTAERVLPEDVEDDLRAAGEDFESECRPGNYVKCPTCGGGARIFDRSSRNFTYTPCPDCVRLGIDRTYLPAPGMLDLDVPEHRAFYDARIEEARTKARTDAEREQAKVAAAKAEPTTFAAPKWKQLPTRAAGVLNGIPVPKVAPGCDYLTHADDEARRVRCSNNARWFEATTGLRVCTKHKA